MWSTVSQSKYRYNPDFFKPLLIGSVSICCGGMFDESISHMCEVRVRSVRLIGVNLLKTLLLILMSIANSSSLFRISYVLMIPYHYGTDRVFIGYILVFQCMCQWTGSRRMDRRSIMLHAGGRGL